jgi:type II secretory pathway component PulJ
MTLVELLVALAVFAVVMIAVGAFEANVFRYQGSVSGSFQTAQSAQTIMKTMLTELRRTAPGANGAYAIVQVGSTTLSFFSDVDNNGATDQVSYTLMGSTLYRAVIKPTGSPPVYNLANQSTTTLMVAVRNGVVLPVFQYYDSNYTGTSSPLVQPVTTTSIRLIKVNLSLDLDQNRSPAPITYSIQVNLRNLKTNL